MRSVGRIEGKVEAVSNSLSLPTAVQLALELEAAALVLAVSMNQSLLSSAL